MRSEAFLRLYAEDSNDAVEDALLQQRAVGVETPLREAARTANERTVLPIIGWVWKTFVPAGLPRNNASESEEFVHQVTIEEHIRLHGPLIATEAIELVKTPLHFYRAVTLVSGVDLAKDFQKYTAGSYGTLESTSAPWTLQHEFVTSLLGILSGTLLNRRSLWYDATTYSCTLDLGRLECEGTVRRMQGLLNTSAATVAYCCNAVSAERGWRLPTSLVGADLEDMAVADRYVLFRRTVKRIFEACSFLEVEPLDSVRVKVDGVWRKMRLRYAVKNIYVVDTLNDRARSARNPLMRHITTLPLRSGLLSIKEGLGGGGAVFTSSGSAQ